MNFAARLLISMILIIVPSFSTIYLCLWLSKNYPDVLHIFGGIMFMLLGPFVGIGMISALKLDRDS